MDGPLDPKLRIEVTARAKKQIRSRMKALRSGYSPGSLSKRSDALVKRLLSSPQFLNAESFALFWPMEGRGELDLRPLDSELRGKKKRLYYPFMEPNERGGFSTGFRKADSPDDLTDRGQGFLEPDPDAVVARPGDIDIVLVPALAADAHGMRIGYGAGYYDATLGDVCPPAQAWVLVYQFQLMAELPAEAHDRACNVIFTDENTYEPVSREGSPTLQKQR